jgi:S-DNA-T family DNA segregation ATPase FtsK/SpoIIIE
VNIITGVIKANFPARMAFKVSSGIDSKTILDQSGAQQLVGKGDLLYLQGDSPVRVQCAFVDTPEVEKVVEYISEQQGYPAPFELPEPPVPEGENKDLSGVDLSKKDPYFEEVARFVVTSQMGSTSYIQRKYNIGFNRAGRIIDQLEVAGIVGPARGSKPREVLVSSEVELESMLSSM